jgi:AcrR family transcriptional regulator
MATGKRAIPMKVESSAADDAALRSTDSAAKRAAITERLADHVLAHGLAAASLRPLARAAGISDRMLLYYFKDKADVIAATLALVGARLVMAMAARTAATPQPVDVLRGQLADVILADDLWPYMCVWLDIAARSARGEPIYRQVGEAMARGFLAWGEAQLDSPTPQQRTRDAAQLLVAVEGMVVLKSVGLADVGARAVSAD